MKSTISFLSILCLILLAACSKKDESIKSSLLPNCAPLQTALPNLNDEEVDAIMDEICLEYPSNPTEEDMYGHQQNLDALIEALDEQCTNMTVSLGCYACELSLPPWSSILFSLDSAGTTVSRHAHLLTPSDGPMRSN